MLEFTNKTIFVVVEITMGVWSGDKTRGGEWDMVGVSITRVGSAWVFCFTKSELGLRCEIGDLVREVTKCLLCNPFFIG